jgi:hypothetical protein
MSVQTSIGVRLRYLIPKLMQFAGLLAVILGSALLFGTAAESVDVTVFLTNHGVPTAADPLGIGSGTTWLYYIVGGLLLYGVGSWVYGAVSPRV